MEVKLKPQIIIDRQKKNHYTIKDNDESSSYRNRNITIYDDGSINFEVGSPNSLFVDGAKSHLNYGKHVIELWTDRADNGIEKYKITIEEIREGEE